MKSSLPPRAGFEPAHWGILFYVLVPKSKAEEKMLVNITYIVLFDLKRICY